MSKRKAPSGFNNLNKDFCDFLIEFANFEKNINRNIHKYNAYRKAASILAIFPKRIESGSEARKLKGIGPKIAKKIDEFIQSGTLVKLDAIRRNEKNITINLFASISGIGPAKAKELVDDGILTLEDLKKNKHKLNRHQKIGLKYMADFEQKIPRSEIEILEKLLKRELKAVDPLFIMTICGSYRRGKPESGDIDILLTYENFNSRCIDKEIKKKYLRYIVNLLKEEGLVIDTISLGDTKFMGVLKYNKSPARRIDIRFLPKDQYFCGVLYFTGSDLFNVRMRAHALEKKFTLSEYSLRPIGLTGIPGEPVLINSEEDIFDYIDFPYKTPEERDA